MPSIRVRLPNRALDGLVRFSRRCSILCLKCLIMSLCTHTQLGVQPTSQAELSALTFQKLSRPWAAGAARMYRFQYGPIRPVKAGMLPYIGCSPAAELPPRSGLGVYGWPCTLGGSIAVQNYWLYLGMVNCMVFYSPHERLGPPFPDRHQQRVQEAQYSLSVCLGQEERSNNPIGGEKLDLTSLAMCVHKNYPIPGHRSVSNEVRLNCKLKGVAVLPGHDPADAEDAAVTDRLFGLHAPGGHILKLPFEIPRIDLNEAAPSPLHMVCMCLLDM